MARPQRFTESEVEYLLKEKKYILGLPQVKEQGGWLVMEADVKKKGDPNWQRGGLTIKARTKTDFPGVPKSSPTCFLQWHGYRIRGVDYEVRHDNPDGNSIRGWHEHIWDNENEDKRVIPASPRIQNADLKALFRWGLEKWRIEIRQEQMELGA
jgi:hypothetical protein